MLEDLEPTAPMQLSFAGCGFLCIYHSGVCAAIKEYAPQLAQNRIRGSSAGAIAAAGLICNVCMSHATSTILQCVTEARAGSLQALSPNFDIFGLVRRGLEESLPPNAHILCSGRLLISATRARDYANVVISEFDSRDELIQAILCSCFIPFYCGRTPPTYRGEHYIDGGFSDNQPGKWEPGTVTVSPFSGESDICPSDEDSASLFGFDFCGTNIQFTTQNAWRMVVILFPPSPEVCSRICRQGFDDALRFLTKNNLVPCVKCLTVQSNAIPVPSSAQNGGPALAKSSSEQFAVDQRIREIRRRRALTAPSAAAKNHKLRHECERCMEPLDRFEPPRFSAVPLPSVVQKTLADMEARNKASWLTWLRQWRIIRYWLRLVMPPMLLPFELLQFTLRKIRSWLKRTALAPAEAYLVRFQLLVDFLLQEIEQRCLLHSPTAAPAGVFPFSVLPVGPLSALRLTDSSQPAAVAGGSPSVSTTSVPPQRKLSLISQRKMSTTVAPLDLAIPSSITGEEEEGQEEDAKLRREDSKRVLQQFCERHDAVLAFHYMDDETNQLKICQIFDANGRNPRQHCHSGNLAIPLEYAGQEEAAAAAQTAEDEAAKAAARCGEDSGLSLEEGEEAVGSQQNSSGQRSNSQRKDACCSPVRHFSAKTAPTKPLPAAVRRHTFSSRSARLSASARTLVSSAAAGQRPPASRFVAPGSRLYASNSMNALKPAELAAGKNAALRRKVSMQTAAERRQSADDSSSSESEATEKAQPRAKQQRKQQPWAAKAQQK